MVSPSVTRESASRVVLEALHQIDKPNAQRIGDDFQRLDGHVALSPLDFANMSAVQTRLVGKNILGPTVLTSKRPHPGADLLLDVLHLKAVSRYSCFSHTGDNLRERYS